MNVGTVVLDSNVVRHLEDLTVRRRVLRGLRSHGLRVVPTGLTLLELASTPDSSLRYRLLDTMAELSESSSVRPLPVTILEWTGRMIAAGQTSFSWPRSGMEELLYDRAVGHDEVVVAAREHLKEQQSDFEEMQVRARRLIRGSLRRRSLSDPWGEIPTFLDRQWTRKSYLDAEIQQTWQTLELPGTPDVAEVLKNEAWRLFFEGVGATVYERCVRPQTQRPVQLVDSRQLVYLAGSKDRMLVTDDEALLRLARAVADGRYAAVRILRTSEFLALM